MRRMTGLLSVASRSSPSNNKEKKEKKEKKERRDSKLMQHQIPSFVELEPDDYHDGVVQSSEAILHARDVLEDPEDFNVVFKSIVDVFHAGHNHDEDDEDGIEQEIEAEYAFARTEWGDEEFMEEHAHQLVVDREKKRLQRHIKRHADEHVHEIHDRIEHGDRLREGATQDHEKKKKKMGNVDGGGDEEEESSGEEDDESSGENESEADERDEDSIGEFHTDFQAEFRGKKTNSMDEESVVTELGT
jgi:hypothetical protein